jgi:hypothetical protein
MRIDKTNILNVSLIICSVAILISDYYLSQFGQGFQLVEANLPSGITLRYDKIRGYKFLEEGFIHILDEHTVVDKDTIDQILAYDATDYDVFVKSKTTKGKILYLNIHVQESAKNEFKYEISSYTNAHIEDWIDLSDKRSIRLIATLKNMLIVLMLILIIVKILALFRRREPDKTN